MCVAIPPHP